MAEITVGDIKKLRGLTGSGILDCRNALEEADGDSTKAQAILREKGLASAAKKATRTAAEGVVESYIHNGSRVGVLLELNCETDFVSRIPEFKELAHHLTMQVAAMAPEYIDRAEMPEDDPRNPEEVCLLQQPFIRDPNRVVQDLVTELAARVGENVRVRRFARFALGE